MVPGLTRIPAVRCPPGARALHTVVPPSPAAFEVPDLVDPPSQASAGDAVLEAPAEEGQGGLGTPEHGFEGRVGGNVLVGGLYGLLSTLLRPGLRRLERRAGSAGQLVNMATSAGVFSLSYAVANGFGGAAGALGRVVARVPVLGGSGPIGQALQMGMGTLIGNHFAALFAPEKERTLDEVFLANMCVMCNTGLEVLLINTTSTTSTTTTTNDDDSNTNDTTYNTNVQHLSGGGERPPGGGPLLRPRLPMQRGQST